LEKSKCYRLDRFRLLERLAEEVRFLAVRPVFLAVFRERFGAGTFAPFFRASERPIAIACFRLVTFFPDLPDRSVPFFFSRIAPFTDFCAPFEYLAMIEIFWTGENPMPCLWNHLPTLMLIRCQIATSWHDFYTYSGLKFLNRTAAFSEHIYHNLHYCLIR
jgi:hypothetical protein